MKITPTSRRAAAMNAAPEPAGGPFRAAIYADLDGRLRASPFAAGAAEAHGVLSGLACRGGANSAAAAARAMQLSAAEDLELVDALRGMVERDLRDDGGEFAFNLLLPGDDAPAPLRAAAVADWCGGFMQGLLLDGDDALAGLPAAAREAFCDIMAISRADAPPADDGDGEAVERQLAEIEEYLRVAAQLIFEELNSPPGAPSPATPSGGAKSPSPPLRHPRSVLSGGCGGDGRESP